MKRVTLPILLILFVMIGSFIVANSSSVQAVCIDVEPDTLNITSCGKWITIFIEPVEYGPADIDNSTILLNGQIAPVNPVLYSFNTDNESEFTDKACTPDVPEKMIKFDRSAVASVLPLGGEVEVVITGVYKDGTPFEGSDIIGVIEQGVCCADCDGSGQVGLGDLLRMKQQFGESNCRAKSCQADCNEDGIVGLTDLLIMKDEFGRSNCTVTAE